MLAVEPYRTAGIRSVLLRGGKDFLASRIARKRNIINGLAVAGLSLATKPRPTSCRLTWAAAPSRAHRTKSWTWPVSAPGWAGSTRAA
jgi:hypothetical protein